MKIPGISRQSGGVGTRLMAKLKRTIGTALVVLGGILFCVMLREFFDTMLDGYLLDWLDRKFVMHYYDGDHTFTRINWTRVKEYLFRGLLAFILMAAVAGRIALLFYAARREKQVVHEAGKMIGDYMRHDREVTEVFPWNMRKSPLRWRRSNLICSIRNRL